MMRLRRRFSAVLMIAALGSAGCDTPSDAEQLAGHYPLMRYQGQAVPLDRGPIPHRFEGFTGCRMVLEEGRLQLSGRTGHFGIEYEHRESCGDRVVSRTEIAGRYSSDGRALAFLVPSADGHDLRFTGRVHPDRIVVTIESRSSDARDVLEFAR